MGTARTHSRYAQGSIVTDIEGTERIDFANNMASLIHGHAYQPMIDAVTAQLYKGTAFTVATEVEVLFAEHLISRNKGFEKIRFVNSGTEAVMGAIKAARAFTSRPKSPKSKAPTTASTTTPKSAEPPNPTPGATRTNPTASP